MSGVFAILPLRYLSLFSDYFALFLLLGIAVSGILMRYFARVDILSVKQFALSLAAFRPAAATSARHASFFATSCWFARWRHISPSAS